MAQEITNFDDVIDSRQIIERMEELESELQDAFDLVSKERFLELEEELEEALVDQHEEDGEMPKEAPTLEEFINLTAADPEHLWHHEAKELLALKAGTTFDDLEAYVLDASQRPCHFMYAEATEYLALKGLADDADGCGDWKYGATLIRETHFKDYAQQLAEDIGAVNKDQSWPNNCIDWDQAARELEMDYTSVAFDGVEYLIRS